MINWKMENEVFEVLAEQGLGPKLYYQNDVFRIEGFFYSRPITVFEMRNDIFIDIYARMICDFNHNQQASERVLKYVPKTDLYIDKIIDVWHNEVLEMMPRVKEAYKDRPEIMEIIHGFETTFLFEGA